MNSTKCKLIYTSEGKPFKAALPAKSYIKRANLVGAELIELKDGFVIKVPDIEEEAQTQEAKQEEVKQEKSVTETAEVQATPSAKPQKDTAIEDRPNIKIVKTFRPRNATEIPDKYKNPAFDYKFVYNDKRAINDYFRMRLGWEIDRFIAQKMRDDGLLFADGSCDSTYVLGDTILMRVPKENAEAYRRYVKERTMDGVKNRQEAYAEKVREAGSKAGGSIEVTHRHLS